MDHEDCVFCQVLAKKLPGKIEYEDDDLAVIWDINPQAPTHLLVIPKKHIAKISEVADDDSDLLCKMMVVAKQVAKKLHLDEQGFRLVINEGRDAGQTIFHLHMHMLSGRRLMWPPG
ncbi:MAG TPA: histidine triad nucleotide-binding protein [Caldithrix abyssi]|uniref:Histidine triad nucleotide-binding protein n=1 Tax=Caldithrix abyssi TaxID=187145 RepID=A0A7V5PNR6_CALAY|nr:histidine triad nucleotide-binding protein [Caldithrix abyssi]